MGKILGILYYTFRFVCRRVIFRPMFLIPLLLCASYFLPVVFENRGEHCLQDERKYTNHTDYAFGLITAIPWKETTFCGIDPPYLVAGNQDYTRWVKNRYAPKPIPLPGQWQFSYTLVDTSLWRVYLPYVAVTTKDMYHVRLGWRWDDIDEIFFPSFACKKIGYNWERILWFRTVG